MCWGSGKCTWTELEKGRVCKSSKLPALILYIVELGLLDVLLLLLAIAMKCSALIWKYSTDRALLVGMEERGVKVPFRRWYKVECACAL